MFEKEKYLQYSGNRYKVTQYGDVLDSEGIKYPTYKIKDRVFVDINWIDGYKAYPVALLVLASFDMLYMLPSYLYSQVEILVKDEIETNLTPANLTYYFKDGPIKVKEYPGFYYIPFFTGYAISKKGELINISEGNILQWKIQSSNKNNRKSGYLFSYVNRIGAFTHILYQHRAMCFVFKKYDKDVHEITVNHIDGIPSNNNLDNLEWSTYSENNIHAIEHDLRYSKSTAVLVRNLKTNEIKRYTTITKCARELGYEHTRAVRNRLTSTFAKERVYPDFLQFKKDDGSDWPAIDLNKTKITRFGPRNSGDIIARNVFTGQLIIFEKAIHGKEYTGVEQATIVRHLRDSSQIPTMGWNFQYLDCLGQWPEHTARHLKIYEKFPSHPRDGVIAINPDTQEETFFTSMNETCEELNLDKYCIWNAIKRKALYSGLYFKSFKLEKHLGLPAE